MSATFGIVLLAACSLSGDAAKPVCDAPQRASFRFGGPIGRRIDANVEHWLLPAPAANPGMIAMFRVRDRRPPPALVPWAGEFVGKYLLSAVQAMRMSDDPRLPPLVQRLVADLLDCQADDGYLGPFPKEERLLKHWDLWGHYHIMLALLAWHDRSGDEAALRACTSIADLVCTTYLDAGRRVYDAGSHEMNMAVLHSLGRLYRRTRQPRHLAMMREIEEDWRRAGDYHRLGLAGVDFYRTPRPRWESLHDVQGLAELFWITGDATYRDAFTRTWASIRDWDLRNTGGFSSGEQATGNPYENSAIETCCSVAWTALSVDALRLTGDPGVADVLEFGLYNAVCGAQHPSGRWWTYNTPMDGVREASAHSIVFQARAGTPELNCCSVNGPRGLGMLSEWAVMLFDDAVAVNYLGPMEVEFHAPAGGLRRLTVESDYPVDGKIRFLPEFEEDGPHALWIRIPNWARAGVVSVRASFGEKVEAPFGYAKFSRTWRRGDWVEVDLPMQVDCQAGDLDQYGNISFTRGPLLLAYDPSDNEFDEPDIPQIEPLNLIKAAVSKPETADSAWIFVDLAVDQKRLRLRDFANAGRDGVRYRTWFSARNPPATRPMPLEPAHMARVPTGPIVFRWRPTPDPAPVDRLVVVELEPEPRDVLSIQSETYSCRLSEEQAALLQPGRTYHWYVQRRAGNTSADSRLIERAFTVDASLPPLAPEDLAEFGERDDGVMLDAPLHGDAEPLHGRLAVQTGVAACEGPRGEPGGAVELSGDRPLVAFAVRRFPSENYSAAVWVRAAKAPERMAQVLSAWCKAGDDPLRVSLEGGRIFARIEGGGFHSTPGAPFPFDQWTHVAFVKEGDKLRLYLNGEAVAEAASPRRVFSGSTDVALGGNPKFSGDESLPARYAGFRLYARALSASEVARLADAR
jgi:DUF1680 family protein